MIGHIYSPREVRDSRYPNLVEISTASFDPAKLGVGASCYVVDPSASNLAIPALSAEDAAKPPNERKRFLFRLCGVSVPDSSFVRIVGLRQYLTIGYDADGAQSPGGKVVREIPVVTPGWCPPDGNVSWHLSVEEGNPRQKLAAQKDLFSQPGQSSVRFSTEPALLYTSLTPYAAPFGGQVPGKALGGSLGCFYDIRFPWRNVNPTMDIYVPGPARVCFWASVLQTDPGTRAKEDVLPNDATTLALLSSRAPEQNFAYLYASAWRLRRIAGSMLCDVGPLLAMGSGGALGSEPPDPAKMVLDEIAHGEQPPSTGVRFPGADITLDQEAGDIRGTP